MSILSSLWLYRRSKDNTRKYRERWDWQSGKWTYSFKIQFAACFLLYVFSFCLFVCAFALLLCFLFIPCFDKTSIDKLPTLIMQLNGSEKDDMATFFCVCLVASLSMLRERCEKSEEWNWKIKKIRRKWSFVCVFYAQRTTEVVKFEHSFMHSFSVLLLAFCLTFLEFSAWIFNVSRALFLVFDSTDGGCYQKAFRLIFKHATFKLQLE